MCKKNSGCRIDIAEYKGKKFDWTTVKGKIKLLSDAAESGFEFDFNKFIKIVERNDCGRVYSITPKVKYQGEEYYYYEETEDKIQLYVIASDLSLEWEPKGFQHTDYEEWTKWVPKSECEKFDKIKDY